MVLEPLIRDFPEQFKNKKLILALTKAFDRQLSELEEMFRQLHDETSLDNAVGKQLDLAGDIVGLTRADAGLLCGEEIFFSVLEDDRYRQYLKYKAHKNSNTCTYYDLITQLETVWGAKEIGYEEDPDYPATIIVTASLLTPEGGGANISFVPTVAPAGVGFLYKYKLKYVIQVGKELTMWVYAQPLCGEVLCGTYPTVTTLGESAEQGVVVSNILDEHTNEYDLAGTYPEVATLGRTDEKEIIASATHEIEADEYKLGGEIDTGVFPNVTSLGVSGETAVEADAESETDKNDYDATGTLPNVATFGLTDEKVVETAYAVDTEKSEYDKVGTDIESGTTPAKTQRGITTDTKITSDELKQVLKTNYVVSGERKCGKYF